VQNRKFLIPILAVLLVGMAVPLSVQRAHGDDTNETLNITGLLARGTYDYYLGSTVDAIQAGNTMTFKRDLYRELLRLPAEPYHGCEV